MKLLKELCEVPGIPGENRLLSISCTENWQKHLIRLRSIKWVM